MIEFNDVLYFETPNEITKGNWILGFKYNKDTKELYEFHLALNEWYHFGLLIDDTWAHSLYNFDYKKKYVIYIVSDEVSICEDFLVDQQYLYFLPCQCIEKKFIRSNIFDTSIITSLKGKIAKEVSEFSVECTDKPILSVITTVFNNAFLLEQTIQSVINQKGGGFEYIVKDACSTDSFALIYKKYRDIDGLRFIQSKDNGIYDGMNQGFEQSTGEYIQILNSDDIFYCNNIVSEYISAIKASHKEAYCSDIKMYFPNGNTMIRKADLSKLCYRSCVNHTSLVLKKQAYISVGGFDLKLKIAADCDLTIKLVKKGYQIEHLNIVCVYFRAAGASNQNYSLKTLKENLLCRYRYSHINILGYLYTILQFLKIKLTRR